MIYSRDIPFWSETLNIMFCQVGVFVVVVVVVVGFVGVFLFVCLFVCLLLFFFCSYLPLGRRVV